MHRLAKSVKLGKSAFFMSRSEALYLLPYFGSLVLSLGILYYTWERRAAKGVTAFTWYTAGQALWVLGFIIELLTPDLSGKIFWDGFQWLAGLILIVAFPVFVVQYTEYKFKNPWRMFSLSLIVPAVFVVILMTDGFHHLIYPNPHLTSDRPFPELLYDFTPVIYALPSVCASLVLVARKRSQWLDPSGFMQVHLSFIFFQMISNWHFLQVVIAFPLNKANTTLTALALTSPVPFCVRALLQLARTKLAGVWRY